MGCLTDFTHICEPNSCPLDALNLTNGPGDDWDSNSESFSSVRGLFPSSLLWLDPEYMGFYWC